MDNTGAPSRSSTFSRAGPLGVVIEDYVTPTGPQGLVGPRVQHWAIRDYYILTDTISSSVLFFATRPSRS